MSDRGKDFLTAPIDENWYIDFSKKDTDMTNQTNEEHTEALQRIQQWCSAYPEDIFIPLSKERMHEANIILRNSGIDIGAIHAQWARHITSGIKKIADKALGDMK